MNQRTNKTKIKQNNMQLKNNTKAENTNKQTNKQTNKRMNEWGWTNKQTHKLKRSSKSLLSKIRQRPAFLAKKILNFFIMLKRKTIKRSIEYEEMNAEWISYLSS